VVSSGEDGGQVVPHLHMHLLGGRRLSDRLC
jgi:diadenosine tetraphosphate (Ap4A) HIT family hydrolase